MPFFPAFSVNLTCLKIQASLRLILISHFSAIYCALALSLVLARKLLSTLRCCTATVHNVTSQGIFGSKEGNPRKEHTPCFGQMARCALRCAEIPGHVFVCHLKAT